jgi:hypothetical protein
VAGIFDRQGDFGQPVCFDRALFNRRVGRPIINFFNNGRLFGTDLARDTYIVRERMFPVNAKRDPRPDSLKPCVAPGAPPRRFTHERSARCRGRRPHSSRRGHGRRRREPDRRRQRRSHSTPGARRGRVVPRGGSAEPRRKAVRASGALPASDRHGCWSRARSSSDSASASGTFGSSAAIVHASRKFRRSRARLNWLYGLP